ncbi:MAG: hypothetical protein AB7K52_04350 [Phycisphaerales bacterium]
MNDNRIAREPVVVEQRTMAPASTIDVSLRGRSLRVARGLRESLAPIVTALVGPAARPASLCRALDIDRTLGARILRSIRSRDGLLVLQEIPAPPGLRIFLEAARRAGAAATLTEAAADFVREFESLIDEFPGGRAALDAAIADDVPEIRERTEKTAKQAMFKSMSCLLGYQVDAHVSTVIIQPSPSGRMCDTLHLMIKHGLRRIRATVPITAFGRTVAPRKPDDPDASTMLRVDGTHAEDGEPCLLDDYCSRPFPSLGVLRQRNLFLYTLDENQPPVNVPATVSTAMIMRNGMARYASEAQHYEWEGIVPRIPAKILVGDVLVRDDVYEGVMPFVSARLYGLSNQTIHPDQPAFKLDEVDLSVPLESMSVGRWDLRLRELPAYSEMLSAVFERSQWDPRRFRAFRFRVQYPVPMVAYNTWFKLPERG